MTETDLINEVRAGKRIFTQHSLHEEAKPECASHPQWRTIACDDHHDVVECVKCGAQRVIRCNLDHEYQ